MVLNSNQIVSCSDAYRKFRLVCKVADAYGSALLVKKNKPEYLLIKLDKTPLGEADSNTRIEVLAKLIIDEYVKGLLISDEEN